MNKEPDMDSQPGKDSFDVVIVGAGMVGLSLACALSQCDLRIAILDRAPIQDKSEWQGSDPRVSAIVKSSEYFLQNIGAWSFIKNERHGPYSAMDVWERDGTASIQFNSDDIAHPELGFIVENRVLQYGMYQSLIQGEHSHKVKWIFTETIETIQPCPHDAKQESSTPAWQLKFSSGSAITTNLLVGADGAMSIVREQLGIELKTTDLAHKAIVCNVETERPHDNTARQIFLSSGPLAFLPLAKTHNTCSIVWSSQHDKAEKLMDLDEQAFNTQLEQAFEKRLGKVLSSDRRFSFPLFQRHAITYIEKHAVLIGDAAHTIHPLAGQGVNLGFMDAAVLAEEIERAIERNINIASREVLRRYERRRRGHVTVMMESMRGFQHVYAVKNPDLIGLRNFGVRLTNKFTPLKNHILSRAMGLDGDLPKLARPR